MSNYAKHFRRGGGAVATAAPSLISITSVERTANTAILRANYTANITAGDFLPAAFRCLPGNIPCTIITQFDPDTLRLQFSGTVAAQTQLEYTGATAGILTPQTIAIP